MLTPIVFPLVDVDYLVRVLDPGLKSIFVVVPKFEDIICTSSVIITTIGKRTYMSLYGVASVFTNIVIVFRCI